MKTVSMSKRPSAAPKAAASADDWVKDRQDGGMKRLTIDIEADLHRRLKQHCAGRGTAIALLLRELIQREVQIQSGEV